MKDLVSSVVKHISSQVGDGWVARKLVRKHSQISTRHKTFLKALNAIQIHFTQVSKTPLDSSRFVLHATVREARGWPSLQLHLIDRENPQQKLMDITVELFEIAKEGHLNVTFIAGEEVQKLNIRELHRLEHTCMTFSSITAQFIARANEVIKKDISKSSALGPLTKNRDDPRHFDEPIVASPSDTEDYSSIRATNLAAVGKRAQESKAFQTLLVQPAIDPSSRKTASTIKIGKRYEKSSEEAKTAQVPNQKLEDNGDANIVAVEKASDVVCDEKIPAEETLDIDPLSDVDFLIPDSYDLGDDSIEESAELLSPLNLLTSS